MFYSAMCLFVFFFNCVADGDILTVNHSTCWVIMGGKVM